MIHVGGEDADVAFAHILQELGRMPQAGAEERTNRLVAESDTDSGNALFNLVLAFLLAESTGPCATMCAIQQRGRPLQPVS